MTLRLYNTLNRQLEDFTPNSNDKKVLLYTCGPTVYSYLTVGNWAAYIYWDTLVRTLMANGLVPQRVMNITDVGHLTSDEDEGEDKMQKGARREGKTAWEVAEFYAEDFMDGMEKLGLLLPEHVVKATDFIPEQLDLIRRLKEKDNTYITSDGIYFDTAKFPSYADFAKLDLAAQKAGARVEQNHEKRNPSDFALWKFSPKNEQRDMEWETPSDLLDEDNEKVMGFPGWHLECSTMAMSILGDTLDIHTGGIDHIPVHHTNEIAQSEASSGKQFSRFWLHNNHLKVDGTKISKSLGNGYTLQDLEAKGFSALDFRMFILQGQYQNEGNFTFDNLTAAQNRLKHWKEIAALRHQVHQKLSNDDTIPSLALSKLLLEALNDNLNTPEALRIVDEAFSELESRPLTDIDKHVFNEILGFIDDILGLQIVPSTPDIDDDNKQLIVERSRARESKDWEKSDKLRDELATKGISVSDRPDGTIWSYL